MTINKIKIIIIINYYCNSNMHYKKINNMGYKIIKKNTYHKLHINQKINNKDFNNCSSNKKLNRFNKLNFPNQALQNKQ